MSRATRQRDAVAPSLFPFLAVLLCTMGALVLILMLIVSGAQASALQIAEESEKQVEEVESQLDLARHSFQKQLAEGRIELEKRRLALQHLENHIQEIIAELEKLERTSELADAKAATDEAAVEDRAKAISELEKQLLEAGEKLKQKLDKPAGDKPIFAIIPYDGPNGTHRRPIYLECLPEGIRIQPEGVLIRNADLEPPYGPGNPLDAALRTIRAHYVPANHAVTSTAYPLLVVRPSGIRSYAMARAAMSGWDDQFGYELVGEELELIFPEGEPGLAQKVAQTLELARSRQAALIMAMPQKYREFAGRGGPLNEGPLSGGPGGSAGGGSGGGSDGSGDYAGGYGSGTGSDGGGWSGNGQSAATSSRGGWADSNQTGNQSTQATAQYPAGGASTSHAGAGNGSLLGFGETTNSSLNFDAAQAGAAGGSNLATNSNAYGPRGAPGESFFGSGGNGEGSTYANGSASPGMLGGASSGGGQSGGGQSGGGQSGGGQSGGGQSGGGSSGDSSSSSRADDSGGPGGGSSSGTAANMSGSQMSVPLAAPSSSGAYAAGSSGQSGAQAANGSANQSAPLAPSNLDGSAAPIDGQADAQGMPQLNVNQSLNSQRGSGESTAAVASRNGRGWAWSQGPPSQTSVVRSIRMQCLSDRWVVLPDSAKSGASSVTIPFEETPQQRAEKLAKVVADRVDQWGIALTGGHWKPVLEVEVAPDAEWRFYQLQQLLAGSGLDVQRKK